MNVAVTGLNATDNPGPGVPVIRSIREMPGFDGRIIGLLYDVQEPGAYMEKVADRCYMMSYPSSGIQTLYDRLMYIHEREKLDVLVLTLDAELYNFEKLSGRLHAAGIRTFLPSTEQMVMRGKDKLAGFCETHGLRAPVTVVLNTVADLHAASSKLSYPFVVKGIFYDAQVVNGYEEALTAFKKISAKWGLPIIVQEFMAGDEYNIAALGDGTGSTVGAVAMRKTYITDKGKGWAGVTIDDPALLDAARTIIAKIKWRGGMELEFAKLRSTQEYVLLEINPRFPAWVYLATAAGQNLPGALVALAMGENVKPYESYEVGKMFIRCSWDLIANLKQLERLTTAGEN